MQLKGVVLVVLIVISALIGVTSASFLDDIMGAAINEYNYNEYEDNDYSASYYAPQPGTTPDTGSPTYETIGLDFTVSPTYIKKGGTITVSAIQTSGTPLSGAATYGWVTTNNKFGNGQTANIKLTSAGKYAVRLTVVDNDQYLKGTVRKEGVVTVK